MAMSIIAADVTFSCGARHSVDDHEIDAFAAALRDDGQASCHHTMRPQYEEPYADIIIKKLALASINMSNLDMKPTIIAPRLGHW